LATAFRGQRTDPILNVVDDVTRKCLGAIPDTSISGVRVGRELTAIIARRGKPGIIVFRQRNAYRVALHFLQKIRAKRLRRILQRAHGDELLNESLLFGLPDARLAIQSWVVDYNDARPHSTLHYTTPPAFAARLTETAHRAALLDGSALRPVAQPAPQGVSTAEALIATG
jgi:putative transposase